VVYAQPWHRQRNLLSLRRRTEHAARHWLLRRSHDTRQPRRQIRSEDGAYDRHVVETVASAVSAPDIARFVSSAA